MISVELSGGMGEGGQNDVDDMQLFSFMNIFCIFSAVTVCLKFALEKKNAGDAARFARNDVGQQKKHIYFLSTSS